MVSKVSVVSLNVRGLKNRVKRRSLFRHIRINYKNSIVMLQETHSTKDIENVWKSEWAGDIFFSHDTGFGRAGIAALIPRELSLPARELAADDAGRIVCLELTAKPDPFILIGVYAPATDNQNTKCQFLGELREFMLCFGNQNTFLVGDFNIKLSPLDTDNPNFKKTRSGCKLNDILEEFSLEDSWRLEHPKAVRYTWRRMNPLQQSRIDFIFSSRSLLRNNKFKAKIDTGILTDHSFVVLDITVGNDRRGPGIWRFNNTLLGDELYADAVKKEICAAKCKNGIYTGINHKGLLIDFLLSNIRVVTIKRSKTIAFEGRKKENQLYNDLNRLERELSNNPSEQAVQSYKNTREELENIKEERGKSAIIRSQGCWMEHGEKSSAYFFNLAKTRPANTSISTLESAQGQILRGNSLILKECAHHFKELYQSKRRERCSFAEFALDENDPRLSEEEKLSCEGPITCDEGKLALDNMARNKAAGISGFTAEFFRHFWDDIGQIFTDYANEAKEQGELFISHRRGVLTLIPKKGNQLMLKNKRPICLLDIVYKIIAKVMAMRLAKVVGKIVHISQTGGIKGRFIGENVRIISDVIEYCKMDELPGILLSVDYKNAFDSLEHDFMFYALESFNFGTEFLSWMRLLHKGGLLTVRNNGLTSEWFPCTRGTFQGSAISSMLFNISVELLSIKLRKASAIKGITISGVEVKTSQYCDDMTLFLSDTESVQNAIGMLNDFQNVSGLEINLNKTHLMWIGSLQNKTEIIYGINTVYKLKILGVWFSAVSRCEEDNISAALDKIRSKTNVWYQRDLTIKGRIVTSKTLLASQIVYLASSNFIKNADVSLIQSLIMKYIWRGRPPKVAKHVICQDIKYGGLKAVDVAKFCVALRMTWTKRFSTSKDADWRKLLQARLDGFELEDVLRLSKRNQFVKKLKIPEFYKGVIYEFQQYNDVHINTSSDVLLQPIWHNQEIRSNRKTLFNKSMYSAGVKLIGHIVNSRGHFLSAEELKQRYTNLRLNFLTMHRITSAIPASWKSMLRRSGACEINPEIANTVTFITREKKIVPLKFCLAKHFYDKQIVEAVPTAVKRWESLNVKPRNWRDIFKVPYSCTFSTRLQSLHYRIIHRYIPTNKFLSTRGIVGSPLCSHCLELDDLKHFFFDCELVKPIWQKVLPKLKSKFHLSEEFLHYDSVLLGFPKAPPVVNLIMLIIKQHIVTHKLNKDASYQPDYENLRKEIITFCYAEGLVARNRNKVQAHRDKWKLLWSGEVPLMHQMSLAFSGARSNIPRFLL